MDSMCLKVSGINGKTIEKRPRHPFLRFFQKKDEFITMTKRAWRPRVFSRRRVWNRHWWVIPDSASLSCLFRQKSHKTQNMDFFNMRKCKKWKATVLVVSRLFFHWYRNLSSIRNPPRISNSMLDIWHFGMEWRSIKWSKNVQKTLFGNVLCTKSR